MPTIKEALKKLVGVQKDSFEKELKTIERMKKTVEAAQKEATYTKGAKE